MSAAWPLLPPPAPHFPADPSWDGIAQMARILAAQASAAVAADPYLASSSSSFTSTLPSSTSQATSSRDPVVISESSSEEEEEEEIEVGLEEGVSGEGLNVAKTVVVPCSGRMGVPTPAIDPAPSTTSHTPVTVDDDEDDDDCIDIETISDDDSDSVVDVESLDDDDDDDDTDACTVVGEERSTEIPDNKSNVTQIRLPPCSTVLQGLGLGKGRMVKAVMTEVSTEPVPSPMSVAGSHHDAAPSQPSHPFSIQAILNRDVFMGPETDGTAASGSQDDRLASEPSTPHILGSAATQDFDMLSCLMSPETSSQREPESASICPAFADSPSSTSHPTGTMSSTFPSSFPLSQPQTSTTSSPSLSTTADCLLTSAASSQSSRRYVSKLDQLLPNRMNSLLAPQGYSQCQTDCEIREEKQIDFETKDQFYGEEVGDKSQSDVSKDNGKDLDKSDVLKDNSHDLGKPSSDLPAVDKTVEGDLWENNEESGKDVGGSEGEESSKLDCSALSDLGVDGDNLLGDKKNCDSNLKEAGKENNAQVLNSSTCVDLDHNSSKTVVSCENNSSPESDKDTRGHEVCDLDAVEAGMHCPIPDASTASPLSSACTSSDDSVLLASDETELAETEETNANSCKALHEDTHMHSSSTPDSNVQMESDIVVNHLSYIDSDIPHQPCSSNNTENEFDDVGEGEMCTSPAVVGDGEVGSDCETAIDSGAACSSDFLDGLKGVDVGLLATPDIADHKSKEEEMDTL